MKDNNMYNIPIDWEWKNFADVGESIIGLTYSPKEVSEKGVLVLRSSNIYSNRLKFDDNVYVNKEIREKIITKENDILICVRNGSRRLIGKCALLKGLAVGETFGAFMSVFRSEKNLYLFHVLQSDFIKLQINQHIGATINQITNKNLNNFKFPLPPLPQQRKIASILSTCDEVIEKTEAAIAKYQALKQGMMHDLFTRGIDINTGKLRPSYQDSPELYQESDLGMIPKDWEVYEIGKLTKLVTDGSHFSPIPQEIGMPIGNVKDMLDSTFNYDDCTKIIPEVFELLTRQNCSPKRGDVLLSKDGTVGKVIHFEDEQQIVLLSSIAIIRVNELIEAAYLAWALRSEIFDKALYSLLSGSALKRITLKDIQKIKIPFSKSLEEQQLIASRLKTIESKLQTEQSALVKYQQLKAGLMQDLLTGDVEVSVREEQIESV